MPYRVAAAVCVEKFREELNDLERLARDARWRRWRAGITLAGLLSVATASVAAIGAAPEPAKVVCKRPLGAFANNARPPDSLTVCFKPAAFPFAAETDLADAAQAMTSATR